MRPPAHTMGEIMAVKVSLVLFGNLKDTIGASNIDVTLPVGSTVFDLLSRFELLKNLENGARVAINGQIGSPIDTKLEDGSEVALLPPSSGG